ncbi:MAG: O-antigen ligase family protein [Pyrinomonadaceae bacterium]
MSRLNTLAFVLICVTVIGVTAAYGTVHEPVIALFYLAIVCLVLLWVGESWAAGTVRISSSPLQIPLLLLGVYGLLQTIPFGTIPDNTVIGDIDRTISLAPFATRATVLHIFVLSIFFAITLVSLDSAARLRRIVTVITVFGFIYAFYAILQNVLSPGAIYSIYVPRSGNPFGSFVNKHDFAAIIEMVIAMPLGMVFSNAVPRDRRMVYIVAIGLLGASLLLSGSRGGLVAVAAELILLVILTSDAKGWRNFVLKAGLSAALVVAAVGGAVFVGGDTSLTRLSDAARSDDRTSSRALIWDNTVRVIKHNFPLGAGLGAYPQAYARFDTESGSKRVEQAHNEYLQILADAGIVGAVIGALFLFWFYREGLKAARGQNPFRRGAAIGAFIGCFAILIHSMFDFVLHITAVSVMFLTLLSILIASGRPDDVEEQGKAMTQKRPASGVIPITNGRYRQDAAPLSQVSIEGCESERNLDASRRAIHQVRPWET